MKKPDRFERMAAKCITEWFADTCPNGCNIHRTAISNLLRREHQSIKRMVKRVQKWAQGSPIDPCTIILDQLHQRRK